MFLISWSEFPGISQSRTVAVELLPYNNSSRHIISTFYQIFQLNFTTIFVRSYVIDLLFFVIDQNHNLKN